MPSVVTGRRRRRRFGQAWSTTEKTTQTTARRDFVASVLGLKERPGGPVLRVVFQQLEEGGGNRAPRDPFPRGRVAGADPGVSGGVAAFHAPGLGKRGVLRNRPHVAGPDQHGARGNAFGTTRSYHLLGMPHVVPELLADHVGNQQVELEPAKGAVSKQPPAGCSEQGVGLGLVRGLVDSRGRHPHDAWDFSKIVALALDFLQGAYQGLRGLFHHKDFVAGRPKCGDDHVRCVCIEQSPDPHNGSGIALDDGEVRILVLVEKAVEPALGSR
ncbi:unnamed protein product [Pseudo-nitzschia multistriata]|uniref:Uncharacterized protein n=1 Tax=Pseudo-nitzschia multistriata TaxID=183589 RepID=A0A448Z1H7_9STRA|nr:unnamed protein product [Pseudo-nitzschia multistriata]